MELLLETEVAKELSAYELERNKSIPSLNHAILQSNIIFELKTLYRHQYSLPASLCLKNPMLCLILLFIPN